MECLDAHDYFNHLEELHSMVADKLDGDHLMAQHNAGIKKRPAFYVGDRVWIMKPKPVGGYKIQTNWTGPTAITSRTGASSFEETTTNGDTRAVHISQIKTY